jgi:replicative DNA helicase
MNVLCDIAAEKAVLSSCFNNGYDAYIDVADFVQESTFTVEYNRIFFSCIKYIFETLELKKPDIGSLHSAANDLGLSYKINKDECAAHINQIIDFDCDKDNVRKLAAKIRKLQIAQLLNKQLDKTQDVLLNVTGNETITEILGVAENAIFNFSDLVNSGEDEPINIGSQNITEYVTGLCNTQVGQVGISSGFPRWDGAIGGGLRKGTVNIIGARAKGFKSGLALNVACNAAENNVPILYLDTEMSYEDQLNRMLAKLSQVPINNIERGSIESKAVEKNKVLQAVQKIQQSTFPFYHKSIAGMPLEEQMAITRRWLFKNVGVQHDNTALPCLIIYDYLKLMDSKGLESIKEYQALGFMMTTLHNFAVRYKIPILAFVQLNRDGISRESIDVVSQSDRISWLCSNFSIFKPKTDDEIELDGESGGNYKLVPVLARHGAGLDPGDYINFHVKKWCAHITEGSTRSELIHNADLVDDEEIDM